MLAVAARAWPELSRRTVRRGVPCALATSASSVGDELEQQLLVVEQGPQLLDGALELGLLVLELDARELRQPTQLQVEDVGGLGLRQVEDVHEAGAGRAGVVGAADDLDDLVDVDDGDEQALDEVEALLALARGGGRVRRRTTSVRKST